MVKVKGTKQAVSTNTTTGGWLVIGICFLMVAGTLLSGETKMTAENSSFLLSVAASNDNPYWNELSETSFRNWPGIPVSDLGHPLVHIQGKKTPFYETRKFLLEHFEEFWEIYKERPDKNNQCGIRLNHSFALWMAIVRLKPTTVIESGINSGQSTYFIRKACEIVSRTAAAAPCKIISLDPEDKPICEQGERWIDPSKDAEYLTGKNFIDFDKIDWNQRIGKKEIIPSSTVVFIDDHRGFLKRFPTIVKYGFRHVINEDNYKIGEGVTRADKRWTNKQLFAATEPTTNAEWWFANLKSYCEFPPLLSPSLTTKYPLEKRKKGGFLHITDDLSAIPQPVLDPINVDRDKQIFNTIVNDLKLNATLYDKETYNELMSYNFISYMEVVPMAPILIEMWNQIK